MCDKMTISAYILKIVVKGPILKASNESMDDLNTIYIE